MSTRLPGFRGEYLWEYDIAEQQLFALAEAVPPARYGWRPVETARCVSEVLVHLGMGCRTLLVLIGADEAPNLYGEIEGEGVARIMAMIKRNENQEKRIADKAAVVSLLRTSLDALRAAFSEASDAELDRPAEFFGERTTVRRIYLRALCHLHEHMGQLVAYARAMGLPAPWQNERESRRNAIEKELAASRQ